MTGPADHRALHELLGSYVLGGLGSADATRLRAHLDGCELCRRELAELAPLAGALRLVDPRSLTSTPTPPPDLGSRILASVAAERELRDRRTGRLRRGRLALAAAAAVVAVGVGGVLGAVVTDRDPATPQAGAVRTEQVALQPVAAGITVTSAELVPHTWGVEVNVVLSGLGPGEVYRAVVLSRDGRSLPAGEFLGVRDRPVVCDLQAALLRPDAAGFLLLDAGGRTVARADLPV